VKTIANFTDVTRAEKAEVLTCDLEDWEPDRLIEVIERDALDASIEFTGDFFLALKHLSLARPQIFLGPRGAINCGRILSLRVIT